MADKIRNVTVDSLRAVHGANAEAVFQEIAMVGGFGKIDPAYAGGLDIGSIADPAARDAVANLISPPKAQSKDGTTKGDVK